MVVYKTQEWVSVMSESEVVAMFATLDGEGMEINMSQAEYSTKLERFKRTVKEGIEIWDYHIFETNFHREK
jgi:hypothetical protein